MLLYFDHILNVVLIAIAITTWIFHLTIYVLWQVNTSRDQADLSLACNKSPATGSFFCKEIADSAGVMLPEFSVYLPERCDAEDTNLGCQWKGESFSNSQIG